MNDTTTPITKNIAETLAEVLPEAKVVHQPTTGIEGLTIAHVAVPKASALQPITTDLEVFLPHPRRTKALAQFADTPSFLAYVERHATECSVVWCEFNPQTFALRFAAVFDEHAIDAAGWRAHRATFEPDMSAEWKAWKGADRKSKGQTEFAEWIEERTDDINSAAEGMPTSLQMLQMATEFQANEERVLKSTVKLQGGGVRLTYVADADAGTTESMKIFEKFALGIPVFHGGSAWAMQARLKYRLNAGKVSFFYELARPDRVHQAAATELISSVRQGLGEVPLLMGTCA